MDDSMHDCWYGKKNIDFERPLIGGRAYGRGAGGELWKKKQVNGFVIHFRKRYLDR